jgi:paxillin
MCGRPVYGDAIHAIGKKWHVDHWVCVNCQTPIGAGQFYEVNGKPHCIPCHKALFAPRFFLACFFFCICWKFGLSCCRCGMCNQPILDRCVVALGRKWHVDHFVCTTCKQPFTSQFFTRDGMPYCELHARV